jgi:hypothetical protein
MVVEQDVRIIVQLENFEKEVSQSAVNVATSNHFLLYSPLTRYHLVV